VSHARARLTGCGRALLIARVPDEGWTAAAAAEAAGVSRPTVYKWLTRFRTEGVDGLVDRSSCPVRSPRRRSARSEQRILQLRRRRKLGPHRLGAILGMPRSTCYAVLRRHGLQRLDWMDRPRGEVIRRYERERPGELIHVDVKKLGRIPRGGGWRALGRQAGLHNVGVGYDYVHSAVDDHSRLAYSEIHANERADTCAGLLVRAREFYAAHGVAVERVMTDKAKAYRKCPCLPRDSSTPRCPPGVHPLASPSDQRQSGTVQPDPARGVGLRSRPYLTKRAARPLARGLAAPVQPPSAPHRAGRPPTHRSCQQPI
jgi:transposase